MNKNDDGNMPVGFTMIFHECIFDSGCNFVVKRNKDSELEKMHDIEEGSELYSVWKKQEMNTAKKGKNKALNTYMHNGVPAINGTCHGPSTCG